MSEENVEIVRRINELFNRGDMEAMLELHAEDLVVSFTEPAPGMPSTIRGHEAARRFYAEWAELFEGWTRQIEEWIDAGDWVITKGTWVGTGKGSGVRVRQGRDASALRSQQGKLVEFIMGLPDKEAAFKAVGLSE